MKNSRKILSVLLALALMFGLASVVLAEDPIGTEENPEVATYDGWSYQMAHVFSADDSIYWFTFTPDMNGLINITDITALDADFNLIDLADVTVIASNEASFIEIEINDQRSSAPFTAWEGEKILIGVSAPAGAEVVVTATIQVFDDFLGSYSAQINDYTFYAYVNPGETIIFSTPMGMGNANWGSKGLIVEGVYDPSAMWDVNPIPETVVTANGVEYKDLKDDGDIKLTMPMAGRVPASFAISYGNGMGYATYKITFVDEALAECEHTTKTAVPAQAPDCHVDGILAHETCDECGSYFIEGVMVDSVVDAAPNQLEYMYRTVTCTADGEISHYHCNGCGKNYDYDWETDIYTELDNVASAALGHNMEVNEAQEPTCCGQGNYTWYICTNCYESFKDAEGNEVFPYDEIWIDAIPDAHNWVLAEEVDYEPLEGNVPALHTSKELVYKCDCWNCWFIDNKDLTTTMLADPSCGALDFHEAVAATEAAEGNIAYYSCGGCGKFFLDAEGATEVAASAVTLPKLEGEKDEEKDDTVLPPEKDEAKDEAEKAPTSPTTGDSVFIYAIIAMAVCACAMAVIIIKKKCF